MRLAALFLVVTTATAAAEPASKDDITTWRDVHPTSYVALGAVDGAPGFALPQPLWTGEGGYRLYDFWWVHALAETGRTGDDEHGYASLTQVRAGVEARGCRFVGIVCGFADLDLAYQHYIWDADAGRMSETVDEVVPVARAGVELGSQRVHARVSVESAHLGGAGRPSFDDHRTGVGLVYQW